MPRPEHHGHHEKPSFTTDEMDPVLTMFMGVHAAFDSIYDAPILVQNYETGNEQRTKIIFPYTLDENNIFRICQGEFNADTGDIISFRLSVFNASCSYIERFAFRNIGVNNWESSSGTLAFINDGERFFKKTKRSTLQDAETQFDHYLNGSTSSEKS